MPFNWLNPDYAERYGGLVRGAKELWNSLKQIPGLLTAPEQFTTPERAVQKIQQRNKAMLSGAAGAILGYPVDTIEGIATLGNLGSRVLGGPYYKGEISLPYNSARIAEKLNANLGINDPKAVMLSMLTAGLLGSVLPDPTGNLGDAKKAAKAVNTSKKGIHAAVKELKAGEEAAAAEQYQKILERPVIPPEKIPGGEVIANLPDEQEFNIAKSKLPEGILMPSLKVREAIGTDYNPNQTKSLVNRVLSTPIAPPQKQKGTSEWVRGKSLEEATKTGLSNMSPKSFVFRDKLGTRHVVDPAKFVDDLSATIATLADLALQAAPWSKEWYAKSRLGIVSQSPNPKAARNLARIYSLTSGRKDVSDSLQLTSQILNARREGLYYPIMNADMEGYTPAIVQGLEGRLDVPSTPKYGPFFGSLTPGGEALNRPGGAFIGTVNDAFMSRLYPMIVNKSIDLDPNSPTFGKILDRERAASVGMTDAMHNLFDRASLRVANAMGLNPESIQSLVWVAIRGIDDYSTKNNKKTLMQAIADASDSIPDIIHRKGVSLGFEFMPDSTPEAGFNITKAPDKTKRAYEAGMEKVFKKSGYKIGQAETYAAPTSLTYGHWRGPGGVENNRLVTLGMPISTTGATADTLMQDPNALKRFQRVGTLFQLMHGQQGVGTITPFTAKSIKKEQLNGFMVANKDGKQFTLKQLEKIGTAAENLGFGVASRGNHLYITDFNDKIVGEEMMGKMEQLKEEIKKAGVKTSEFTPVRILSTYQSLPWRESKVGSGKVTGQAAKLLEGGFTDEETRRAIMETAKGINRVNSRFGYGENIRPDMKNLLDVLGSEEVLKKGPSAVLREALEKGLPLPVILGSIYLSQKKDQEKRKGQSLIF